MSAMLQKKFDRYLIPNGAKNKCASGIENVKKRMVTKPFGGHVETVSGGHKLGETIK